MFYHNNLFCNILEIDAEHQTSLLCAYDTRDQKSSNKPVK